MEQGGLLLLLLLHLVLTGLPAAAAALCAARRGLRSLPVLLAIALAASGAVGQLSFWAYFGGQTLGQTFSFFVVFGAVLLCGWSLWGGRLDRSLLIGLATPAALWALGSAFLTFFGFLHGGADQPLATAASRFYNALPSDNYIPQYFSEWFYMHGHYGTPPIFPPDWLASDRPPLQVGYVMSQRPFGWDSSGLHYQLIGLVLQQLWIVGLWALLLAARVRPLTRGLAMVTVLVSDLALVNGFFVWPKLLPAALLLAVAALVMTPLWRELRGSLWGAALVAALCGLAMMGHGSSVFGVIPLAAVAIYRGVPSWRWIGVAAVVGIVVMAPWSAYQKYGDPPGNRLTKQTLAGVSGIDDRGTVEAILDEYGKAGLGGALHDKGENVAFVAGGSEAWKLLEEGFDEGGLGAIVRAVRAVLFLHLLPSLGLLLGAPLAMALWRRASRRNRADWDFAVVAFAIFLVGVIAWVLIVFGGNGMRTAIHHGSYLLPILGISGAVAGLRAVAPRFSLYYVGFAALLGLAVCVPAYELPLGTSYSALAALLAAVSLTGFVAVALRSDPGVEAMVLPLTARIDSPA